METMPSKLTPAITGGMLIGLLLAIPVVGDCLCCMWIAAGGVLAGYLYSRTLPPGIGFTSRDGAVLGLLSGFFGAMFSTFLMVLLYNLGLEDLDFIDQILESGQDIPPEIEGLLRGLDSEEAMLPMVIFIVFMRMFFYSIFGMAAGILSVQFFKNKKPPLEPRIPIL